MNLPCWMALALLQALLGETALGQRWSLKRRPLDMEGSSNDEFFDDEDLFSGSGSGFPEMERSQQVWP
ncbi:hypothetical protein AAFF_G00242610 [Aldrovandia affinis]|uniref:Uncharacterized protein n=1 Tax=Aldrovandia affinis TaxID=143900 RepID=A0AAD7RE84_9TELE|nr:hypothetical protein AAFF_G00242610 [Aldrovandia affinis]